MKYLGMTITKNIIRREDINISNCIAHMKKSLSHWLTRDLTIFGHFIISVILSKAEGISKVIHPSHSLYVSSNTIRKANSVGFQFLWRNKTHYIKRSQLVKEYDVGSIKALDFESVVVSFKISWLKAYL